MACIFHLLCHLRLMSGRFAAGPVSPERSELRSRRYAECDSFTFNLQHWQVIAVAPSRGGFVFISWRGGAAGLFVSSSTPIYPFNVGRPAAPPRHETQLRASLSSAVASAPTLRVANRVTNTALSPALSGWISTSRQAAAKRALCVVPPTARR